MARKSRGNATLSYNSHSITVNCKQVDLDATIERLDTTNLGSTAKESIAGDAEWKISASGDWDDTFDGYMAPDAVTPGTARTGVLSFVGSSATVSYTWTSKVEIQDYKVSAQVGQSITWSATFALSGAPTRVSA